MSPSLSYRPDIDGLRAIAVLSVVVHHFWPEMLTGGYVGVDVFFVISGFLITKIIHREITESRFRFADFYDRRIRRIFPALFTMLGVTLVVGWFLMLPSDYLSTFKASIGTLFFSANIVFWRQLKEGYFAATDVSTNPLLHTWSLGVEEQFYIVFPILLLLLAKYRPQRQVVLLYAATVLSLGLAQYFLSAKPVAVFFLTPFRAWELLVGALLALHVIPDIKSDRMRESIAATGMLAILIAAVIFDARSPFPGLYAVLPVLGTAAVIHAGSTGTAIATSVIRLQPVVYIGLISYSLYLWHWPVLVLGKFASGFSESGLLKVALLAFSFTLAVASYHFVERPFRSSKMPRAQIFGYAAAGTLVLLIFSIFGWRSEGYPGRVDSATLQYDSARTPFIPYVECDKLVEPCRIGLDNVNPNSLFWGDSHMLAWVPGLSEAVRRTGNSAWLSIFSLCPPLLGVDPVASPGCQEHNDRVISMLASHGEVRVVVLAAYWSAYAKPNALISRSGNASSDLFEKSLRQTISTLRELGKTVVLIGPVPIYEASVPLRLALERHRFVRAEYQDLQAYELETKYFNEAFASQPELILANPGAWLCKPVCARELNGHPLYRDSNHLSVMGAKILAPNLYEILKMAYEQAAASRADGKSGTTHVSIGGGSQ